MRDFRRLPNLFLHELEDGLEEEILFGRIALVRRDDPPIGAAHRQFRKTRPREADLPEQPFPGDRVPTAVSGHAGVVAHQEPPVEFVRRSEAGHSGEGERGVEDAARSQQPPAER